MLFNVLIVAPSRRDRAHLHDDLALLLTHALEDLGHEAILSKNQPDPERVNLILGGQGLAGPADLDVVAPEGLDYVVVQTDPNVGDPAEAGPHAPRLSSVYLPLLRRARAIWEVQPERRASLGALGLDSRQLLLGYHPALDVNPPKDQPDLDAFFFGGIDAHRQGLLQGAVNAGLNLEVGGYQDTFLRNESISRACLQLAPGRGEGRAPLLRIATLLNMGGFVVVEDGADLAGLESFVVPLPTEGWVQGCASLVKLVQALSPEEQRRRRTELHENFRNHRFTDLLAPLVEELEGRP